MNRLPHEPAGTASVHRELAEIVADLRTWLDWEVAGGTVDLPAAPAAPRRPAAPLRAVARAETPAVAGPAPTAPRAPVPRDPAPAATPGAGSPPGGAPRRLHVVPPPADAAPAAKAATPELRARTLGELQAELGQCTRCPLHAGRTHLVFGAGPENARVLLVGEAPGQQEDETGEPFVGAAGELLMRILGAIGLSRDDVYIANVLKCRPPRNRDPQPPEIAICKPFLVRQIEIVRPELIVALGRFAAAALIPASGSLNRLRGRFYDFAGIPVRPTYHPSAVLRDESLKRPVWEDMKAVRAQLGQAPQPAAVPPRNAPTPAPAAGKEDLPR